MAKRSKMSSDVNQRRAWVAARTAEAVRPSAPDDLRVQLEVSRAELQVILMALWHFPGHGDGSPEWRASEFHSLIGRDISMLKPLRDHVRAVTREVDAPYVAGGSDTELPDPHRPIDSN